MNSNDLMNYIPSIFHNVKQIRQIFDVQNAELEKVQNTLNNALEQTFILGADKDSIRRYEQILNIEIGDYKDDLEFRRNRIAAKFLNITPINLKTLKSIISRLIKNSFLSVTYNHGKKTVYIKIPYDTAGYEKEVIALARRLVPISVYVNTGIYYIEWENFDAYNYSWSVWDSKGLDWQAFEVYYEKEGAF